MTTTKWHPGKTKKYRPNGRFIPKTFVLILLTFSIWVPTLPMVSSENESSSSTCINNDGSTKTDGSCPTSKGDTERCVDEDKMCPSRAEVGECTSKSEEMLKVCRNSCDICIDFDFDVGVEQIIHGTGSEQLKELEVVRKYNKYLREYVVHYPEDMKQKCRNKKELCAFWTDIGNCDSNRDFMIDNCPLACRICEHFGDVTQSIGGSEDQIMNTRDVIKGSVTYLRALVKSKYDEEVVKGCRNSDEMCSFWAATNECESNPGYMHINCALACQACGGFSLSEYQQLSKEERNSETDIIEETPELQRKSTITSPTGYDWNNILKSRETIISSGNVWPPSPTENANDCILILSSNQVMQFCPATRTTTLLLSGNDKLYRGAFSAPGTDHRRIWLLTTPWTEKSNVDYLEEFDTLESRIVQRLRIPGSADGHDAIRDGNRVFVVDTRHGYVHELALPASAAPYEASSVRMGAKRVTTVGLADVVMAHKGFTRLDHINNVSVHPDVLLTNVHGGSYEEGKTSRTRLSAMARRGVKGELSMAKNGFLPVTNTGNMCHNVGFYEDHTTGQIKLITLDSKEGTLVSVVVSGPGSRMREREVIWTPDLNHPGLIPPKQVVNSPRNRYDPKVFSKGLAVQGGVAYFTVSYALIGSFRKALPYSLIVAVDLASKKELFTKIFRCNGVVHHLVTESYLGHEVRVPMQVLDRTEWHEHCMSQRGTNCPRDGTACNRHTQGCCACGGGKKVKSTIHPLHFDVPVIKVAEEMGDPSAIVDDHVIDYTVSFPHQRKYNSCLDKERNVTRHMLLEHKAKHRKKTPMRAVESSLDKIVMPICRLDVTMLQKKLIEVGDAPWTEAEERARNVYLDRGTNISDNKPGVKTINLIFCNRIGRTVYHFPFLKLFLPLIQETVLKPLGIDIRQVYRMQFADMATGSKIVPHVDNGGWVLRNHRVHVPITTHDKIYFLSFFQTTERPDQRQALRLKSNVGEVFEINNSLLHTVQNRGGSRVHLIIDWGETMPEETHQLKPGQYCVYRSGMVNFDCDMGGPKNE